ncbi:leucine-rich repeat-containing protein [Populus alba x Populus x berolinensis]|uniref:Leucine-rich repeat-containing protein n=1 Tax=Populus alba x Populus x berolinensis TaxID=444605 RepID=A0AAD6RKH1_9ROSI|nr:leucine-rich repeat-containing protein [Populus alba x Populus x berolinensis]
MFRSARWRSEKNKIKTVFKLQFHATQWFREESCRWEYPVYETVKYIRDVKTGKINERIYHFFVSTGSSKNSLVGEVSIDFADYAEATIASSVSLPLKNSKSEVLHDGPLINASHNSGLNGNNRTSSGSDITMSCSESISGLNTPRELGLRNNMLQDPTSFLSSRTRTSASLLPKANASAASYVEHQQPQWELSADSAHDTSNYDSTNSSHGSFARERSQQASDIEMEKLKSKLVVLTRQQDVSELEIQTLRKQIVKEIKRGRHLSREILGLKGERDMLKSECEKLKAFQKCMEEAKSRNKLPFKCGDPFVEEVRQELNYEKDLNSNLRLQLQKTLETNAELILAVKDLNEMLEQKSRETSDLSNKARSYENAIPRRQTCDDEEQNALEELVKEHKDAKETYPLEQKIMDLCSEIEIYRGERDELEMQMEQLALDYEILKQENHDMSYKLEQSQLQEQLNIQYECSPSFPYTNELEAQVESLENELKKQSKENSDSLTTIKELQTHIKSLEKELEQQAQEFDADLGVVTSARVEQEQRAIRAEEALRKTKLKNANTAEKLQEEFRRLSIHMASTFDANEKVAMKALAEASELHMQKGKLEEMLQKANEELHSVKDGYESKLHVLSNQLNLKMHQIEQMSMEIEDKSRQLEQQEKHDEECVGAFSHEIQGLKAELEMLSIENDHLSEQAEQKENMSLEVEQMKTSIKHTDALVQKGNMKRNELVSTISLLKKEAEKSQEELNRMRCLRDEKESAMSLLQSEVRMLKAQCDDLKHCLFEDELAKEKLRRQLLQLKSELKKKEDALTSMEKKLKESNKCTAVSQGTKSTMRNNKFAPVPYGSKEMANQRDRIKLLEVQMKLKETSLEASANSFSEKERDLQNKIEELEGRVEELNQNCASFCCNQPRKSSEDNIGITPNGDIAEDLSRDENPSSSTSGMSKENGNLILSIKSDHSSASELEPKTCSVNNTDHNANEELGELESLKERNKSMENELKEMQERYSEMSLKFAQVEGERQQLVMTLRNLKNATARKT